MSRTKRSLDELVSVDKMTQKTLIIDRIENERAASLSSGLHNSNSNCSEMELMIKLPLIDQ